jgi:hypothetical protein
MRKFLVKHFVGDYYARLFGSTFNWVRAANIIFPLGCINGIYLVKTDTLSFETVPGIILLGLFLVAVFFGFVYFKLKPIKWDELDDSQKWQYGTGVKRGVLKSNELLQSDKLREWAKIDIEMYNFLKSKENWNLFPLFVNPIIMVITFLILIL